MANTGSSKIALIATGSNQVSNIIIAGSDYSQDGYTAQIVASGVFCEAGMYYNAADSLYYQDEGFTTIYNYAADTATDDTSSSSSSSETASS